jgi:O-acetylserine/cysteine efflux transporter
MRVLDFWIMFLCCAFWGGNFVMAAWALGGSSVPPFMLAATRAGMVLLLMGYFLFRPFPEHFLKLLFVALCVGPIHLAFLYTGLQTASASGASILSQALIPISTLLSVVWLKEHIGWRRSLAIIGALVGVIIMIYEPGALGFDPGLIFILGAYISLAIGTVVIRRIPNVDWRVYVAWTAVLVLILSSVASILFESGHVEIWRVDKGPLLLAAGYAAIAVSVIAHGQYFRLLQKYPVNRVVPLTILVTVFATMLGILLLDEIIYRRYIIGAVIILPCVWFIAQREPTAFRRQD